MTNKLPTLDGEPRELRDGDRVELRNGMHDTVTRRVPNEHNADTYPFRLRGYGTTVTVYGAEMAGQNDRPGDVVRILGPAEEVATVRIPKGVVPDGYEPVAIRGPKSGETFLSSSGDVYSEGGFKVPRLVLRRIVPSQPPLIDRIAAEVIAGRVVFPPKAVELRHGYNGIPWQWVHEDHVQVWRWSTPGNGELPTADNDVPVTIPIADINAAVERLRKEGSDAT